MSNIIGYTAHGQPVRNDRIVGMDAGTEHDPKSGQFTAGSSHSDVAAAHGWKEHQTTVTGNKMHYHADHPGHTLATGESGWTHHNPDHPEAFNSQVNKGYGGGYTEGKAPRSLHQHLSQFHKENAGSPGFHRLSTGEAQQHAEKKFGLAKEPLHPGRRLAVSNAMHQHKLQNS